MALEITTLADLFKCASDLRKVAVVDDDTPLHRALDVDNNFPPPAFLLAFNNLTYSVHNRHSPTKTIIDDISGEARDGQIMAVLGPSGSGKSTLIDALANRIAKGSLKGSITLNGEKLESQLQKAISAYVMQDDLLFPMLTVKETLIFAAEFRLPRTLSKSQKATRVQDLINQLGLQKVTNTLIGDEGHRGVSGGERRRVSIGIDIINDPILLFLDEPTSGLDSTSAFMVVQVLQTIAQTGSIVIMSIHQPSNRIVGLLDRMIILSAGKTVYSGPPSNLPLFFAEFQHPIPDGENRTEFALDLIRELETTPNGTKSLVDFNKSKNTPNQTRTDFSVSSLKEAIAASISRGKLVSGASFANPSWIELTILSKRSFTTFLRMPKDFFFRLGVIIITGFILSTVFFRLDNSPKGIQERLGFFTFAMTTTFYSCADTLPFFLLERYIFMRETAYNTYRRSSYVLSITLVFLPMLLLFSLVFAVITFWAVGLDGSFFFYFLIVFASFWAGSSFITFLSGVVPDVMLGYIVAVAVLAYYLLFGGFFINRDRISVYWVWFHYISLIKYPYEAVLQNEFYNSGKCFIQGIQIFDGTPLAAIPEAGKDQLLGSMSRELGLNITRETCIMGGMEILKHQGVTDLNKWQCLWVTVGWGFFFRILFYLSLLIGSKNKRR